MAFYTNFATDFFHTVFTRNFKKRPKSDFRQKSNFLPYSDALNDGVRRVVVWGVFHSNRPLGFVPFWLSGIRHHGHVFH